MRFFTLSLLKYSAHAFATEKRIEKHIADARLLSLFYSVYSILEKQANYPAHSSLKVENPYNNR